MGRSIPALSFVGLLSLFLVADTVSAAADTRLVDAVKTQNTVLARSLIGKKIDVNVPAADGATALHWAAQWNDVETAELLLKAGATINVGNDYRATPLWLAALNGSAPLVDRLLAAGADPNMNLATGETPLMAAARTGSTAAVRALARRGARLEAKEAFRGQTALMWAVAENHLDTAKALIELGANVSARSASGFTPLMFAAREGHLDAGRLLLGNDADINAVAKEDGSTPLIVAVVRGHSDFAMFLLDKGADPNLAAPGYTALHWAAGKWESLFTWDYPHVVTGEWGRLIGVREGRTALIRALLAHGADVNARTTRRPPRFGSSTFASVYGYRLVGATPFYVASIVADVDVMRLLLASGAAPTIRAGEGTTALMMAAGHGRHEPESRQPEANYLQATKLCIELGLDVNARNDAGETAMYAAAVAGLDSVVQYLFDRGADLNARTASGQTPLQAALHFEIAMTVFEHPSTAALLRKLGATE